LADHGAVKEEGKQGYSARMKVEHERKINEDERAYKGAFILLVMMLYRHTWLSWSTTYSGSTVGKEGS
jgi:hypothetical protein